jgi:hypothetical protein
MSVTYRAARADDLPLALSLAPEKSGAVPLSESAALQAWTNLLQEPYFFALVAEAVFPGFTPPIAAFGAVCFVPADFVDQEIAHPSPGLNSRFLQRYLSGKPTVLTRTDVARGNATTGINVLEPFGDLHSALTREQASQVLLAFAHARTGLFLGYRFASVIAELAGDIPKQFCRGAGYPVIEFPDGRRAFSYLNRDILQPGSVAMPYFHYTPPVLNLTEKDQQLLIAALEGATDDQLAPRLGLPPATVKARWRSLLARTEQAKPEWQPAHDDATGRGPQRRHRILAYCREHPEELRPYDATLRPQAS